MERESIEARRRAKLPTKNPLKTERENKRLKEEKAVLEEENSTDPLTGVLNRRGFERYLDQVLGKFRAHKEHNEERVLSVLAFDIDYFKSINDTFGHPVGDLVLKRFAEILKGHVRETDVVARVGGEEFAFVMETTKGKSYERAEDIRKSIEDSLILPDGRKVTVSIGIAETMGHGVKERLLERADQALYRAKQGGRNRTEVAGDLSIAA